MKVKYIIVNIVNRNVKMEVVSRDTYIPYMKVKHTNVDIALCTIRPSLNKTLVLSLRICRNSFKVCGRPWEFAGNTYDGFC